MQSENEPSTPIRVNISRKVDRSLKNDLEKLERVSTAASSIKPDKLQPIKSASKR